MQSGLEILKTVVDAHGIRFRVLRDSIDGVSIEGIENFDDGLRGQLYQNYNYSFIEHQIREDCREGCLYIGEDAFGLRYLLFRMSDTEAGTPLYLTVGPYMQEGSEPDPAPCRYRSCLLRGPICRRAASRIPSGLWSAWGWSCITCRF